MKISKIFSVAGLSVLGLGAVVMLVAGCQMPGGHTHGNSATTVASAGKSGKGGAQLWAVRADAALFFDRVRANCTEG
jgi:hypothetical protein